MNGKSEIPEKVEEIRNFLKILENLKKIQKKPGDFLKLRKIFRESLKKLEESKKTLKIPKNLKKSLKFSKKKFDFPNSRNSFKNSIKNHQKTVKIPRHLLKKFLVSPQIQYQIDKTEKLINNSNIFQNNMKTSKTNIKFLFIRGIP